MASTEWTQNILCSRLLSALIKSTFFIGKGTTAIILFHYSYLFNMFDHLFSIIPPRNFVFCFYENFLNLILLNWLFDQSVIIIKIASNSPKPICEGVSVDFFAFIFAGTYGNRIECAFAHHQDNIVVSKFNCFNTNKNEMVFSMSLNGLSAKLLSGSTQKAHSTYSITAIPNHMRKFMGFCEFGKYVVSGTFRDWNRFESAYLFVI